MTRLYLDQALDVNTSVSLELDAAHRLDRVLRLKPGDSLTVFNGRGGEFSARVVSAKRREIVLGLTAYIEADRESSLEVSLIQGISRGERMDFTIQKAVELGVKVIYPVLMERSVVRLDPQRAERRRSHWSGVVRQACEQSGRTALADVAMPQRLDDLLDSPLVRQSLILDTQASRPLRVSDQPGGPFAIIAGPEGGFSDGERSALREAGAQPIRLGPRTLRTETAALTALSIIQAWWGDLSADGGE